MKYYYSFFRDTNTEVDPEGQLYKVVIKTKKGDGEEELLLSGSPFTVKYNASDDIYKPLKSSMATVGILNKELNLDFNPEELTDVEVTLYKLKPNEVYNENLKYASSDGIYFTVEWSGFATPNAYSQGYNSFYDEFQLECQDKLSTLYYLSTEIIYKQIPNSYSILTFNILLHYLINFLGLDKIYVTTNIKTQYSSFFNLAISTRIIFLDNGEFRPIKDSVESVLKAFNLTAIQYGNSIYIINYDAISTEYSTYNYITGSNTQIYEAEIRNILNLENLKASGNNTNISLLENKTDFYVKVNNEENNFIINDLSYTDFSDVVDDNLTWDGYIKPNSAAVLRTQISSEELKQNDFSQFYTHNITNSGDYENFCYTAFKKLKLTNNFRLNEVQIKLYAYDQTGNNLGLYNGDFKTYSTSSNVISCNKNIFTTPLLYCSVAIDNNLPINDIYKIANKKKEKGFMIYHPYTLDIGKANPDYSRASIPLASEEYLNSYNDKNFIAKFECMRLKTPKVVISKKDELHFSYDMKFFADYSVLNTKNNLHLRTDFPQLINNVYIAVQFISDDGKYYLYKGMKDGYSIINEPLSVFTGNDLIAVDTTYSRGNDFFNTTYKIIDTNKLRISSDEYFTITSPLEESTDPNHFISGNFIISIFRPFGVTSQIKTFSTFISNISLVLSDNNIFKPLSNEDKNNNDKEISYEKENFYYKDDLKEEINISTTDYSNYTQLNTLLTTRDGFLNTYDREVDLIYNLATGNICTPMELVINSYKNQYLTPTLVLNAQVHNDSKLNMLSKITYSRFPDKSFIVNSMSIDYAYNSCNVQLIEKK